MVTIVFALSVLVLMVVSEALLEPRTTTLGTVLRQLRLPPADLKWSRRRAEAACAKRSPSFVPLLLLPPPSLVLEPLPPVLAFLQFTLCWWWWCPRAGDDCNSPESAPLPLALPPFAGKPRFSAHPCESNKIEFSYYLFACCSQRAGVTLSALISILLFPRILGSQSAFQLRKCVVGTWGEMRAVAIGSFDDNDWRQRVCSATK